MTLVLIAAGFVLLVVGGETLVRGAVGAARRLGVSPMLIGLTLVGFGTSTPELLTSVQAALAGSPGIAVGNVVGSNICNILLILGIAALVAPIAVKRHEIQRDGGAVMIVTLIGIALIFAGWLDRLAGVAMLIALAIYLIVALKTTDADVGDSTATAPMGTSILFFVGGLALTLLGARLLVQGAISAATALGVSEAIIGLTVVAIGTSLPELVTSVVAARRGEPEVALGNVLGSNIFNILGILGVTVLVRPIEGAAGIGAVDLTVLAAATVALVVFAVSGLRITRGEGAALVVVYLGYLAWLAAAV